MIIIYKITDYFPETDQIAVKFCREKSPTSIDDYNPIAINLKDLDDFSLQNLTAILLLSGKYSVILNIIIILNNPP